MWAEFVIVPRPCSEGFSPSCPVFFPPQKKNNIPKFQFVLESVDEEPLQIPIFFLLRIYFYLLSYER